jgi:amino acid adenylation domain-containing protein
MADVSPTVTGRFEQCVLDHPNRLAVVSGDESITFAELDAQANQIASGLISVGVELESLVGLYATPGIPLVASMLGILKAGGAYVPLNPTLPSPRLQQMIESSGMGCVVDTTGDFRERRLPVESFTPAELTERSVGLLDPTFPVVAGENLIYVIFTSGSTGVPKGVMVEHRNVLGYVDGFNRWTPFPEPLISTQTASYTFDASVIEFFPPLCYGGTIYVVPEFDQLGEIAARSPATMVQVTAALLPDVADALEEALAAGHISAMQLLLTGIEAIPQRTLQRFRDLLPELLIINDYGPTEATCSATQFVFTEMVSPNQRVPIGTAIPGYSAYIVDERHRPVGPGQEGELIIGGVGVARGYLNDPAKTVERFIPNPFSEDPGQRVYLTGDIARYLPDGNIEFIGRRDTQIKLRGMRVELGEIDSVLLQRPELAISVTVANEDAGDTRLVSYVVPQPGAAIDVGDLRKHAAAYLPGYMVPSVIMRIDSVPLTVNGKTDYGRLPKPDWAQHAGRQAMAQPATPMERALAESWQELLKISDIGVEDSFFDRGGHSLSAARLMARVRHEYGIKIPLREFFGSPTIRGLAALIEQRSGEAVADGPTTNPVDGLAPLGFAQERMWLVAQLEPDNPAFDVPAAFRLTGPLDLDVLRRSFAVIIERHAILRTTVGINDGMPVQIVNPPGEACLEFVEVDLSSLPPEGREAKLDELCREASRRTFDPATLPQLSMTLFKLGPDDHVLFINMPHMVTDAWSIRVMEEELAEVYRALVAGVTPILPDLPIDYTDYARRQRSLDLEADLAYWESQLAGATPAVYIEPDHRRPARQSANGAVVAMPLGGRLYTDLQELSVGRGTTLYMTLLAALDVLLWRYSGREDVVVGSFVANRSDIDTERVLGMFVNTVAMRAELDPVMTFAELQQQVRVTTLEALDHRDVPIEQVLSRLRVPRDMSTRSLFQVIFNMINVAREPVPAGDLVFTEIEFDTGTAIYDLDIEVHEGVDGLLLNFRYNTDLYERETIERLVGHYQRLLEAVVLDPARSIAALPMLTAPEEEQVLVEWNATERAVPHDVPIQTLIERQAAARPEAAAVVQGDQTLSYGALNSRANQLARLLQQRGVGPETVVGVYLERSPTLIVSMLAILKAGGAYLPLDPDYPVERVSYILSDADAQLLVSTARLTERLPNFAGELLDVDLVQHHLEGEAAENPQTASGPSSLAYVIYTSGSTGQPKGVLIEHHSLVSYVSQALETFGIEPGDRVLQFASISFDISVEEIFVTLAAGAALLLRTDDMLTSIPGFLRRCGELGVTVLDLPTAFWNEMVGTLGRDAGQLPASLRTVIIGGERALSEDVETWRRATGNRVTLFNTYGPTEATIVATVAKVAGPGELPDINRVVPIGRPVANVTTYLVNAALQPVPAGLPGELLIGGEGVARGYLGRPELTAERFVPNPFSPERSATLYRTGDLARYWPDGMIEFLGRNDDQLKIQGFRVEPGEIENALLRCPGVGQVAVAARRDPAGQLQLVAWIVPEDVNHPSPASLTSIVSELLPRYMLPARYAFLDALPLTPSGKVDRNGLPDPDWFTEREVETAASPEHFSPVEEKLARIWERLLGVPHVGLRENFFTLGGHSLLAVRMMTEVEQEFGISLPLVTLFQNPTVAHLAEALSQALPDDPWPLVVPIQPEGNQPPLIVAHELYGDIVCYFPLVPHLGPHQPVYGLRQRELGAQVAKNGDLRTDIREMAREYVDALTEAFPEGPYVLAGYSLGGVLVLEMAHLLTAQGRMPALVQILDSDLPGDRLREPNGMNPLKVSVARTGALARNVNRAPLGERASVLKDIVTYRVNRKRGVPDPEYLYFQSLPEAIQRLAIANQEAFGEYQPRPYPGPLVLYLEQDRRYGWFASARLDSWRRIAKGPFQVRTLPFTHDQMLKEPWVREFAGLMRHDIDVALARSRQAV